MVTTATCSISLPALPRIPQRRLSQTSVRTKQSRRQFLLNTGNLEVCNREGLEERWRIGVSFFPSFLKKKGKSREEVKEELLQAIEPLDRGAEATPEDQERIDQIASELEALNTIKEPLKSDLLNGKWELIYTTSRSILQTQRPKFLRPNGKIYQAINADTLRAQNMETWPYFNQATSNLVPLSSKRVAVRFDSFKIFNLIPIKARGSGKGELEITYLDEEIRVSRGNQGNLFILKMVDCTYRAEGRSEKCICSVTPTGQSWRAIASALGLLSRSYQAAFYNFYAVHLPASILNSVLVSGRQTGSGDLKACNSRGGHSNGNKQKFVFEPTVPD